MTTKQIRYFLLSITVVFFTACGGSSGGDNPQDTAIEKISNYAQNGGEAPTLQDYTDAGVTGVSNVDDLNAYISDLTKEDVDSPEEIQAHVNTLGVELTGNIPPIARAGALPTTVTEGETVQFSSNRSVDTDGTIVSYKWTEGGVGLANVPSFTKSDFSAGTHTITLTVTDDGGATDYDTVTITVESKPEPVATTAPQTCLEQAGYGTVTLSNGQIWLDRNLGDSAIGDDGDFYQWGRSTDGHEKITAATTSTQATTLDAGHGDFITVYPWTTADLSSVGWDSADGTNQVCPCGFVVPTFTQVLAATAVDTASLNFSVNNVYRDFTTGNVVPGAFGYAWYATSDASGKAFLVQNGALLTLSGWTGHAMMIRCIDPSSVAP